MAVGPYSGSSGYSQTLVEEWSGSGWTIVPSPDTSSTDSDVLDGVSCVSATFCMAVGAAAPVQWAGDLRYSGQTLIEEWDGSSWTIISSPDISSTDGDILTGVSCVSASFCVAVGTDFGASGVTQTLIERWDGAGWGIVTSPDTSSADDDSLNGVSCAATSFCMAVGDYQSLATGGQATLTEKWDGSAWTIVPSPDSSTQPWDSLQGVSCPSTTFCMAVGQSQIFSGPVLATEWDGSTWTMVSPPAVGTYPTYMGSALNAVSCTDSTFCIGIGHLGVQTGDTYWTPEPLMEQWDGAALTVSTLPSTPSAANDYFDYVSALGAADCASATFCMAVGDSYNNVNGPFNGQTLTEQWSTSPAFIPPTPAAATQFSAGGSFTVAAQEANQITALQYAVTPTPPPGALTCSTAPTVSPQTGEPATISCSVAGGLGSSSSYDLLFTASDEHGRATTVDYELGGPTQVAFLSPPTPAYGTNFSSSTGFQVVADNPAGAVTTLTETAEGGTLAAALTCSSGASASDPAGSSELECIVNPLAAAGPFWMVFTATSEGSSINLLLTAGTNGIAAGPVFGPATPPSGSSFSPPNDSFDIEAYDAYGGPVTLTMTAPDGVPPNELSCTIDEGAQPPGAFGSDLYVVTGTAVELYCTVKPQDHSVYPLWVTASSSYGPETLTAEVDYSLGDGGYTPTVDGFKFDNRSEDPSFADMAADYSQSASQLGDMYSDICADGLLDCTSTTIPTIPALWFYADVYSKMLYEGEVCFGMSAASTYLYENEPWGQARGVYTELPEWSSPLPFSFEGDSSATIDEMIGHYESTLMSAYGSITDGLQYLSARNDGNQAAFAEVQNMLRSQGAVVLGLFPSAKVAIGSSTFGNLVNVAHTVVAYGTGIDAAGDEIISIYDPNSPDDDTAELIIDRSGGVHLVNDGLNGGDYIGDSPTGANIPSNWQIVPLPDSAWESPESLSITSGVSVFGFDFTTTASFDQQQWVMDLIDEGLTIGVEDGEGLVLDQQTGGIVQPILQLNGGAGGSSMGTWMQPDTQGVSGEVTTTDQGSYTGVATGTHVVTVTETDSDPAGVGHTVSVDPTGSVVTLADASSAEEYEVDLGAQPASTYGRDMTVSGLSLAPSDTVTVGTDAGEDSLTLSAAGASQSVQLAISQTGENASSETVTALVPGGGQQATITVGDWSDLTSSPIDETIDGTTTNLNPQGIAVNVTGTQVFGGIPAFTPDYSADAAGTAATVSGTLSCSTSATSTSTVTGGPYTISGCSGLSSTLGPITYTYGSLTVTPAPLTVVATPASPTMTYGGAVPSVAPAYVGLEAGDTAPSTPAICTTAATSSSTVAGGPYSTSCSGASDPDYAISYDNAATVAVAPASLLITATPLSTVMPYGGPVPGVTPTYTGLVNGASASATPPICTTAATATSPLAGSPYATRCSGASDPNYTITYNNTATIAVVPDPLVVGVTGTQVYGGTPVYTPSYVGISWVGSDGPSVVTGKLVCSTNATASSPVAGSPYTISNCSGLSAANYQIGYSYGELTVTAEPLTITATPASTTMTYGGPVPAVTPTYTGLVNGSSAPATPATCTTTLTATSPVSGSPYATGCSGAKDPNYAISYSNGATITVVPRPIAVTVTGTQLYGGTPVYTPSYSGVSWVGTDSPSVVTGKLVCSTTATASSPVAGNPYTISGCSGLSAANYSISYSYGALTVTPAPLTITATPSSTTMTYGGPVPAVTPTYTGLVNGNKAPATAPTCNTKATATSPVAGSPYATSCSGASDPDYTITYTNTATITVQPRPIVVTVTGTQVYGSTPIFTPSYTGVAWVGTDGPSVVTGTLKCSTTATVSSLVVGSPYAISGCSGLSAANYSIGYSYGPLTVTPAATATSLTSSANPAALNQTVTYTATVTSTGGSLNPSGEGSVTFLNGTTKLCSGAVTLSGDRATCAVTYPAAGSYPITASYSGGSDFAASTSAALTEVVGQDATTTSLGVSSTSVVFGQKLTLTAMVAAKAPGSGVPTGTVSFLDGTALLGTATLNGSGQAILTTQGLLAGTHAALTAVYAGSPNYLASTSAAVQVVVAYTSCITTTHTGALTVTSGEVICITGTQTGAVSVQAGGALAIVGGHVTGAVQVSGATAFMACGATITGALSVTGVTGPVIVGDVLYDGAVCAGNTQTGAVSLSNNTGPVALGGSTVTGAVSVNGNVGGPTVIEGNHITGALSCSSNAPAPTDDSVPNTVTGARSGQCIASGF